MIGKHLFGCDTGYPLVFIIFLEFCCKNVEEQM